MSVTHIQRDKLSTWCGLIVAGLDTRWIDDKAWRAQSRFAFHENARTGVLVEGFPLLREPQRDEDATCSRCHRGVANAAKKAAHALKMADKHKAKAEAGNAAVDGGPGGATPGATSGDRGKATGDDDSARTEPGSSGDGRLAHAPEAVVEPEPGKRRRTRGGVGKGKRS